MGKILVVGSIGYDMVFQVHGNIRDKLIITAGKIDKLDMLFTASALSRRYGGIAGNIAYGISELGGKPVMFSVVGEDYKLDYQPHLLQRGVEDKSVIVSGSHTATYYAISDQSKELIAVWQPNAHEQIDEYSLLESIDAWDGIDIAIFSPGTAASIARHMAEFKQQRPQAILIFDPGPIINFFPADLLSQCMQLADIVIGNEVEIPILESKFDYSVEKLLQQGIKYVITTRGESGVQISSPSGIDVIPAFKPRSFVESTGAGDAFRAGLLYGLSTGMDIKTAAALGAKLGSLCVEDYGGQHYTFTKV